MTLGFVLGTGAINTDRLFAFYYEHVQTPSIDVEVHAYVGADQAAVVQAWKDEVARKYTDAVLIICHGTDYNGQWCFVPQRLVMTPLGPMVQFGRPVPVSEGIKLFRKKYGMRRLVLATCNPGHYRLSFLDGPVTYATDNVYVYTDRLVRSRMAEHEGDEPYIPGPGCIHDFRE